MPGSGIAESYGNSMFNHLRSCQNVFAKELAHFIVNSTSWPILIVAVDLSNFSSPPSVCKVVPNVILIYIYLMANYMEHLFRCLLATDRLSLDICLFRSFAHF